MSRFEANRSHEGQVNVTIDRLVLRGLDPADRTAFVDGLRTNLASLLADPATRASLSAASASRRTPVLRLGQVAMQPGISGAHKLGSRVARAIVASGAARGARP
jgi:hypothetical protein